MRFWSKFLYAGQKTFSASSRGRWAGLVEIGTASLLILGGFIFIVAVLALQYLYSNSEQQVWYYTAWELALRLILAFLALGIGFYRMLVALWKVSTTVERRGAIVAAAGDMELLREWRDTSTSFPSIPRVMKQPVRGERLPFRLVGGRRNLAWLVTSAIAMLAGFGLATTSGVRFYRSLQASGIDYMALIAASVSFSVGIWAAIAFFRQAMRLAAFGPTVLEISDMPLVAGKKYRIFLFQPGRFRFKLLAVLLICEEITTFTRGTDMQSERRVVGENRLFRQRGVNVTPREPFETEFEFEIPVDSFHSFSSANNQVQWKIVVLTLARGWPQFEQTFPVVVYPTSESALSP